MSCRHDAIGERQDTIIGNQEDTLLALAGLRELAEETARVVLVIEPQVTAAVADMHRQTQRLLEADAVEREQQLELLMASTRAAQSKADEQRTAYPWLGLNLDRFHVLLSSMLPRTRRAACYFSWPCLSHADWCLYIDAVPPFTSSGCCGSPMPATARSSGWKGRSIRSGTARTKPSPPSRTSRIIS